MKVRCVVAKRKNGAVGVAWEEKDAKTGLMLRWWLVLPVGLNLASSTDFFPVLKYYAGHRTGEARMGLAARLGCRQRADWDWEALGLRGRSQGKGYFVLRPGFIEFVQRLRISTRRLAPAIPDCAHLGFHVQGASLTRQPQRLCQQGLSWLVCLPSHARPIAPHDGRGTSSFRKLAGGAPWPPTSVRVLFMHNAGDPRPKPLWHFAPGSSACAPRRLLFFGGYFSMPSTRARPRCDPNRPPSSGSDFLAFFSS